MARDKKCAYCHAILFDDDDVVYCPECGAPHHRECYNTLGRCAREQFHGEPEQEDSEQESSASEICEQTASASESHSSDGAPLDSESHDSDGHGGESHICGKCGRISSNDTLFCPYCGTPFAESGSRVHQAEPFPYADSGRPSPFVNPAANPYGGVDPSSDLDGVPASEAAIFVRTNSSRYLPVFHRLANKKRRTGWNWSSFFFSYGWLFYRKCYFAGFVSILFTITAYIMTAPYCITLLRAMSMNGIDGTAAITQAQYMTVAEDAMAMMEPFSLIMLAMGVLLILIIHTVLGMFGDRIYLNRMKAKLQKIKSNNQIEDKISAITVSGGVNIISAVFIVYLMLYIVFQNVIYLFY